MRVFRFICAIACQACSLGYGADIEGTPYDTTTPAEPPVEDEATEVGRSVEGASLGAGSHADVTPPEPPEPPAPPVDIPPFCTPGVALSCYGGPDGTLGVGVCRAGTKTCNETGSAFGPCIGEKRPTTEACNNKVDDDCDGAVDEGCKPSLSQYM